MNIQIAADIPREFRMVPNRFTPSASLLQISDGVFLAPSAQPGTMARGSLPQIAGYLILVEFSTAQVRIWPTQGPTSAGFGVPKETAMLVITPNALAEQAAQMEMVLLDIKATGKPFVDATIVTLTRYLIESFVRGERGRSFARRVADTLCLHLVASCGRTDAKGCVKGGLASWQQRRVEGIVQRSLSRPIGIAELAGACGLSHSHFTRAFRQSIGEPPHRWLLGQRIKKAKNLLLTTDLQLAEIAFECGFSDQSHFNRTFSRLTGITPRRWRRSTRSV